MLDDLDDLTPTPEAPGPNRRPGGIVVAIVVAVLAVIVGIAVVASDDGDDKEANLGPARALEPDDLGEVPAADDFQHFRDPDGEFSMKLPTGWQIVELSDSARPQPADIAQGNSIQHFLEESFKALPESTAVLAFDENSLSTKFLTNVNVLSAPIDQRTTIDDLVDTAAEGIALFGGEFQSSARVSTLSGQALRVRYRDPSSDFEGLQYQILAGSKQWLITFSAKDIDAKFDDFDRSARSFQLIRSTKES